ncbi:DUF397 domain-containing protein [Streptomyces sp. G5(2025)]|uniref:DUF397 domain-containing protein n=1 Tax=Streptomyces sp. G5(2025) TaxID=3406628 RepID=UPI003C22F51E
MNEAPSDAQLAAASWFKSSYSAADNECVEVAHIQSWVGVRDSKDLHRDGMAITAAAFAAFVESVKAAE